MAILKAEAQYVPTELEREHCIKIAPLVASLLHTGSSRLSAVERDLPTRCIKYVRSSCRESDDNQSWSFPNLTAVIIPHR